MRSEYSASMHLQVRADTVRIGRTFHIPAPVRSSRRASDTRRTVAYALASVMCLTIIAIL